MANTDAKLYEASSAVELSRQMLQCSWATICRLDEEVERMHSANAGLANAYDRLYRKHEEVVRELGELRANCASLSRDLDQSQKVVHKWEGFFEWYLSTGFKAPMEKRK